MDVEEWRRIAGYPDYEVSNLGRVKRVTPTSSNHFLPGKILRLSPDAHGYGMLSLCSGGVVKKVRVHTLVCAAFNGNKPSPKHHAAHRDGNPSNNISSNIRWATAQENSADSYGHGTRIMGDRHPKAKLTVKKVLRMRESRKTGSTLSILAKEFGVSIPTVSGIVNRKEWSHV